MQPVTWAEQTVWWHVYPLGFTAAPARGEPVPGQSDRQQSDRQQSDHRLGQVTRWLPHAVDLGCDGLLLGPVFASHTHGYDTVDHFTIDPRLGSDADFDALVATAHRLGVRVLLDGVFNHVGLGFATFRAALRLGSQSAEARWFRLHWDGGAGTPRYDTFEGHDRLVALNHSEPAVADHVISVMGHWLDRGIDGWRLDAAYAVPAAFWRSVLEPVRAAHPHAWFVGEVIHGDYARYVNASGMDSITQYELWKAIWSSLNDTNLFELAWALGRHDELAAAFAPLTFVGNHDVTRLASRLRDRRHLGHALAVLFSVPGSPCVYSGDEFGLTGVKQNRAGGDDAVRPPFPAEPGPPDGADPSGEVLRTYRELIAVRRRHPWLARARLTVPYLKNAAAVLELTPRPAGQPAGHERLRVLLNLQDDEHRFPAPLAGDPVAACSGELTEQSDPRLVGAHGWRVTARSG